MTSCSVSCAASPKTRCDAVLPGRDPGGIIVTMLLGIAGAVLGGFMGRALGLYGEGEAAGFVMSFIGAVILLAIYRMMVGRSSVARP